MAVVAIDYDASDESARRASVDRESVGRKIWNVKDREVELMAKCEWAILCDYAFLDVGRKICLIGIFDRIFARTVPSVHHQAALALKFVGEPKETIALRIEVIRPTGEVLSRVEGGGQLGDGGTAEIQFVMANLPLPDFGIYAFNVYIGKELEKTITITVIRPQEESSH